MIGHEATLQGALLADSVHSFVAIHNIVLWFKYLLIIFTTTIIAVTSNPERESDVSTTIVCVAYSL